MTMKDSEERFKLLQFNVDNLERVIIGLQQYDEEFQANEYIETVQYMKELLSVLIDDMNYFEMLSK